MIKKEPHRRICTRFSGHRFKIEKFGFHHGYFPECRGGIHFDRFEAGGKLYVLRLWGQKREERDLICEKRKYLLSVLSKFIENSKILC